MLTTHISSPTKQHLVDMAIVDSSRNPILLHRHDATETVIGCPNLSAIPVEGLWKTWSPGIFWKNWRSFFWEDVFLQKTAGGGGYCVFFYHLVFKFQEFWFLPMLSHCFYQLVSFHLFHVLQKLTMTPEHDDSPSSESLSGGQVLCEFFGEKSSISSSFCTQPKPHVISGYENIL